MTFVPFWRYFRKKFKILSHMLRKEHRCHVFLYFFYQGNISYWDCFVVRSEFFVLRTTNYEPGFPLLSSIGVTVITKFKFLLPQYNIGYEIITAPVVQR